VTVRRLAAIASVTITPGAVITFFVLMQMTAHVAWDDVSVGIAGAEGTVRGGHAVRH
jgi:hypothetical protein